MNKEQKEFYNAQIGSPLQIAVKDNEPLQKQIEEMIEACKKMVIKEIAQEVEKLLEYEEEYADGTTGESRINKCDVRSILSNKSEEDY